MEPLSSPAVANSGNRSQMPGAQAANPRAGADYLSLLQPGQGHSSHPQRSIGKSGSGARTTGRESKERTAATPAAAAARPITANRIQTEPTPMRARNCRAINGASVQAGPVIAESAPK